MATVPPRDVHAELAPAAWGHPSKHEPRWPAALAKVAAIGLLLALANTLRAHLGPPWVIPALEGVLCIAVLVVSPRREGRESPATRAGAIVLIALINAANVSS